MSVASALKKNFETFRSKDVASAAVLDEPLQDRSALLMELLAASKNEKAYRLRNPVAPLADSVVYPMLLTGDHDLHMTRPALEDEIRLLLERRTEAPFAEETYVYSVRALDPPSFQPTRELEAALTELPTAIANNARVGYITHEALYGLLADEGRLVALLDAFLRDIKQVEVKVRRAPEAQQAVRVTLDA